MAASLLSLSFLSSTSGYQLQHAVCPSSHYRGPCTSSSQSIHRIRSTASCQQLASLSRPSSALPRTSLLLPSSSSSSSSCSSLFGQALGPMESSSSSSSGGSSSGRRGRGATGQRGMVKVTAMGDPAIPEQAFRMAQRVARCAPVLEDGLLNNASKYIYVNIFSDESGSINIFQWLPHSLKQAVRISEQVAVLFVREVLVGLICAALYVNIEKICRASNWLWGTYVMKDDEVTEEEFHESGFGAAVGPLQFIVAAFFITRHVRLLIPLIKLQLRPILVARLRAVSLTLAATWFFISWKNKAMHQIIAVNGKEKPILLTVNRVLTLVLAALGGMVMLEVFGLTLKSVFAIGGISGVAVGFAAKELVTNCFGGLILFVTQPFVVGNAIKAGNFSGKVTDIGFVQTKLEGGDRSLVVVPNHVFLTAVITNFSRARNRVLDATFPLRTEDIVRVRRITNRISALLSSHPELDSEMGKPVAFLKSLGSTSLEIQLNATFNGMSKAKFVILQQEILEMAAEIIIQEGGFIGSNSPFGPAPISLMIKNNSSMYDSSGDPALLDAEMEGLSTSSVLEPK